MIWQFPNWRKLLRFGEPLLPGLLVSSVVVCLSSLGVFAYLENLALDELTRWRGSRLWSEELLVIDIDDATVKKLNQYPLSRKYYADLLQKLIEVDNRVVAFDILMSEPDESDRLLADAMAEHGGVILATTLTKDGQPLDPNLALIKHAKAIGQIDDGRDFRRGDFDGITRRHRLSISNRLSLAASTAVIYSATADLIALPKLPKNELLINWPGPVEDSSQSLAYASFSDVIENKIPKERLANKIILVGSSARGVDQDIRTPFDSEPVSGVFVYAAVLHNLLQENWLRTPPQLLFYGFLLLIGPLTILLLQGRSFLRQVGFWVSGVSLWLCVCFGARFFNYALPVATPIVLLSLTEGLIIFTDRLRSSAILQARNEFLGTMSHELRTPLNAIIGISEMMQETHLDPRQREFSETIQNSSQALLALINDVLDFSKIEAGRLVLEEHPVNLRNSIEESLDIVATRAAGKPLDLVYMIDPNTSPVIISDPIRLRQILLNLLSNAVKFTDQGEVAVIVQPSPSDELGAPVTRWKHPAEESVLLLFAVRDTGIGIPKDRIAQIFEPFRQASTSTTRKYGGTGLGLTISKRLAETMGGRLWVESEVNQGSTFFFTIRAQIDPVTVQPERPAVLAEWANRRLLIIDKNTTRRKNLYWQLEALDVSAVFCRSVAEALLLVQQGQQFDGVILDAAITKIDSTSAIQSLRQAMDKSTLPFILLADLKENFTQDEWSDVATVWKPIKQASLYRALMHIHATSMSQLNVGDVSTNPVGTASSASAIDEDEAVPFKVLIVDDNPVNQRVAQHMLQLLGHQADTVATGGAAISAVEQGEYDVVLMDMRMPQMSGIEATRRIRQLDPKIPQPWIIAMTANASSEDRARCLKVGMNDYLSKPIRRDNLSRMFKNIDKQPKI